MKGCGRETIVHLYNVLFGPCICSNTTVVFVHGNLIERNIDLTFCAVEMQYLQIAHRKLI